VLQVSARRPFTLSKMTTTQRAAANLQTAIEHVIVARPARIPADLETLEALSPMQHSFRNFSSLNVRMIDHISDMIQETLASKGAR
jgi:hypothetical protein